MHTTQAAIAQNWEIALRNPDAPGGQYTYPYYLRAEESDWPEFVERLARLRPDRVILITDQALPAHLTEAMVARLRSRFPTIVLTCAGGEKGKHLLTVQRLLEEALAAGVTRSSVVVALGGGLVGNIAGLVAGLCLRGLPLVQVPTTLLAQSDSVLSLKQGVNGKDGKNLLGLFLAPAFVWSHLSFLETLPAREVRAARCEMIKNALAIQPDQIPELRSLLSPQARSSPAQFARLIELCIEAKTAIMADDAWEKHEAVALEYGHTVGHAIELLAQGSIPHGEAIGIGMMVEADIAHRSGLLSAADVEIHQMLMQANGSPTTIPATLETEQLLRIMRRDNKRGCLPLREGKLELVLLDGVGHPHRTGNTVLIQIDEWEVRGALNRCRD